MYCSSCGAELKDGAKFCSACGAKVDGDIVQGASAESPEGEAPEFQSGATFASQMEADKKRSRRKLSPLMIIALVLALVAGTALAAVLIVQSANQGEEPAAQEQPVAAEPQAEVEAEGEEVTEEQLVIRSLDGWWGVMTGTSAAVRNTVYFFDNGAISEFDAGSDLVPTSATPTATYEVTGAPKLDEPFTGQLGHESYTDEDGYTVSTTLPSGEFYYFNDYADELLVNATVGSLHRVMNGDAVARAEAITGLSAVKDRSAEADAEPEPEPFDQAKAEAEALEAAVAAGEQVVSGTVHVTTYSARAQEVSMPTPDFASNNETFVVLLLDAPAELSAMPAPPTAPQARTVNSICIAARSAGQWAAYDGQRVTVAFAAGSSYWFSDVTGVLSPMDATSARRIAPLTEADVAPAGASGDYVLADSSTRAYSRSELEAMDLHTLFLARNEIYARHGRQFQNAELQQYFGSKSWYNGTIAPSAFSESVLSQVERDNANLMLAIEKERNSPYLG